MATEATALLANAPKSVVPHPTKDRVFSTALNHLPKIGKCQSLRCWFWSLFYKPSAEGVAKAYQDKAWKAFEGLFRKNVTPSVDLTQQIYADRNRQAIAILERYHPSIINQGVELQNVLSHESRPEQPSSLLYNAFIQGDEAVIEGLLARPNIDVNRAGADGKTPLHLALIPHFHRFISQLLAKGADIGKQDDAGNTALHYAAGQEGSQQLIRTLLRVGPLEDAAAHDKFGHLIDLKNKEGKTALDLAMASEGIDEDTVRVLIKSGAKHNLLQHIRTLYRNGHFDLVKECVAQGLIDFEDLQGVIESCSEDRLMNAFQKMPGVLNYRTSFTEDFLEKLYDNRKYSEVLSVLPKVQDLRGQAQRVFDKALDGKQYDIAQKLLARGVGDASKLLDKVLQDKDYVLAQTMLQKGAGDASKMLDVVMADEKYDVAKEVCARHNKDVTQHLLSAVETNNAKKALAILDQLGGHIRLNARTKEGASLVQLAMKHKNDKVLASLLKNGASVQEENREGNTLLHLAVVLGHLPSVVVLVMYLAQRGLLLGYINRPNRSKITPLDFATSKEISEFLSKNGAKTKFERTAIELKNFAVDAVAKIKLF
jgi:ankyrin repeat protein